MNIDLVGTDADLALLQRIERVADDLRYLLPAVAAEGEEQLIDF